MPINFYKQNGQSSLNILRYYNKLGPHIFIDIDISQLYILTSFIVCKHPFIKLDSQSIHIPTIIAIVCKHPQIVGFQILKYTTFITIVYKRLPILSDFKGQFKSNSNSYFLFHRSLMLSSSRVFDSKRCSTQ